MDPLFKLLGVAVGCYVAYGLSTGAIYAKSKLWGRTFRRDEEPVGYWSAVVGYTFLAGMLLFVF